MNRQKSAIIILMIILTIYGCGKKQEVMTDPNNPVTITVWHDYTGMQKNAFDSLTAEFNQTEGQDRGIYVIGYRQDNAETIEENVYAALAHMEEAPEIPNIISADFDIAREMEKQGILVDISAYLTEEELSEYVGPYVEEGKMNGSNALILFPIVRFSDIMMINKTDWDQFAMSTGTELTALETREGVAGVARDYYVWTDDLTPEKAFDGQAFYGRDDMAGLFMTASAQIGTELFAANRQQELFQADREVWRHIWDYYYAPYIKGYFKSFCQFRSDDVKIGEIIAYSGSTASAMYFPNEVEQMEETYPIEYIVMPEPVFEGGKQYTMRQGLGMMIMETTPEEEYASAAFLKWFTKEENNIVFGCASGGLPVIQSACRQMSVDMVIEENGLEVSPETYDAIITVLNRSETVMPYRSEAYYSTNAVREVLENHLQKKADLDRREVVERMETGLGPEEAAADLLTQEAFETWYTDFCIALEEAGRGSVMGHTNQTD